MRRTIKDRLKDLEENRRKNYIKVRISQLMDDMNKAHDQHDKNWYNRLIQEYSNDKVNLELEPKYVIDQIESILDDFQNRLIVINNKILGKSKLLDSDEIDYKLLLKISLYV